MTVYTIPADVNFLEALGSEVLRWQQEDKMSLSSCRILLPHRRACQGLQEAFLDLSHGRVLLLPQIRPIGDVEEEALFFANVPEITSQLVEIPPAISELRRRFLLVQLIRQMETRTGLGARRLDQALKLAQALGQLLDQVIIEELSLDALEQIVPADYADHWQITLDFLEILRSGWPQILRENGVIDSAERRNRLLNLLAQYWQELPPQAPIIAAGSTGTMPATARLLKVIADLPRGAVVLPGLDQALDEESWQALDAAHPQSLLKDILQKLECERDSVQVWPAVTSLVGQTARRQIAMDMMRPPAMAHLWRDQKLPTGLKVDIQSDLDHLSLYECDSLQQEAKVVALKLREVLEEPGKTAAFVTPDRGLAKYVRLYCARWGITLDDTAGKPLSETVRGGFLTLPLDVFHEGFRPSVLLSLLKHPLCLMGASKEERQRDVREIDLKVRGPAPKDIFAELKEYKTMSDVRIWQEDFSLFEGGEKRPAREFLTAHIDLLEHLATSSTEEGANILWQEDDGEAAALFLSGLLNDAESLGMITATDYRQLIQTLLRQVIIRPKYGTHPRLLIMGQIEARLIKADVMILGGLNEGTWPALAAADPWMSRPMRHSFGLPDPERSTALAAHDFIQAFSAPEVVLTRTVRLDGAPTVPARWLQRLDVVIKTYGLDPDKLRFRPLMYWAHLLDAPDSDFMARARPAPCPLLSRRPVSLPVTAIERWMRDPYSIYARYILRLRPLDSVEEHSDLAQRGSWLHAVFEWFIRSYPTHFPDNSVQVMLDYALTHPKAPASADTFIPRLQRLLQWFVSQEKAWREVAEVLPHGQEIKGTLQLPGLELFAKADRIDRLRGTRNAAIIDYKTGTLPSNKDVAKGLSPQLPLEALILQGGGYLTLPVDQVEGLYFWKPGSGATEGEVKAISGDLQDLISSAEEGLLALIESFQDEQTPYVCLPDATIAPPEHWQDYAQLARVKEWAVVEEGGES